MLSLLSNQRNSKPSSVAEVEELNSHFANSEPQKILKWALDNYDDSIALACSLSAEDTVLLHMMYEIRQNLYVFVLDTGRLHEESYETLNRCRTRYNIPIKIYFPDTAKVEQLVKEKGPFSFYESLENRKECCFIRKVEPLNRALRGVEAWVTGLRRDQSITRKQVQLFEMSRVELPLKQTKQMLAETEAEKRLKINPLLHWNWQQVLEFAEKNKVPINPLHKKGYPSIGCQPCTRAVQQGEDLRAGRWWWEAANNKECGLHIENNEK